MIEIWLDISENFNLKAKWDFLTWLKIIPRCFLVKLSKRDKKLIAEHFGFSVDCIESEIFKYLEK